MNGLKFYPENVACNGFMDAGRRHETLASETNDFITHGITDFIGFMFELVLFPR